MVIDAFRKCTTMSEKGPSFLCVNFPGGRLQRFLPRCKDWGFSNPPIVVHAKNNKIDP